MKLSFKSKFWLVIGIQILILLSLWGYNQYQLVAGERVLLKLVPPRDPLSLLQGHYLALNYEISRLEAGGYVGPTDFRSGEVIYVILGKKDNYYQAFKVSRRKPGEGIFIKGKVISNYRSTLGIVYGIEHYFIPEAKAEEIEKEFRKLRRERRDIFIEVSLDKFGRALIRGIFIEGKKIDIARIEKEKKIKVKARDARRKSDISQIAYVMEMYYHDHDGQYPQFESMPTAIEGYIRIPIDPGKGFCPYQWVSNVGNPQQFCVWACLETGKFFAASSKGTQELDAPPTDLSCW